MSALRYARLFMHQLVTARSDGQRAAFLAAISDFPNWLRTQEESSPLEDAEPWITYGARRELARVLTSVSRAFEYGAGGSTLFLARRVEEVVSAEHDPAWYEAVRTRLASLGGSRVSLLLRPPSATDRSPPHPAFGYESTDERYRGMSFVAYASSIDEFPDGYFDLVLIDGRARPACFRHAHPKVRLGGWIVLDNSERPQYAPILRATDRAGWPARHHFGPGPYVSHFWRTTLFLKAAELPIGVAALAGG